MPLASVQQEEPIPIGSAQVMFPTVEWEGFQVPEARSYLQTVRLREEEQERKAERESERATKRATERATGYAPQSATMCAPKHTTQHTTDRETERSFIFPKRTAHKRCQQ